MEDSHFVGLFLFLCVCVCVEKKKSCFFFVLFCGHTWPLLLLSGMAHTECNVRKFLGKSLCWLYLGH